MKVIIWNGSPRKEGNTYQALQECVGVFAEAGIETELIQLGQMKIESCKDCRACAKLGRCAINDGFNEVIDKIRGAEGFIVGAPVYFGTARGDVMSGLQRLGMVSRYSGGWLYNKVGGPVAVARRGGQTMTLSEMLMFFYINGMVVPGGKYWNLLFAGPVGEVQKDIEGMENMRVFASHMAEVMQKLHK